MASWRSSHGSLRLGFRLQSLARGDRGRADPLPGLSGSDGPPRHLDQTDRLDHADDFRDRRSPDVRPAIDVSRSTARCSFGRVLRSLRGVGPVGRPFTTAYARENAPPEFWEHPVFIRLNLLMTLVWCGLMTVNIGFAVIGVILGGNLAKPLLSFGLPTVLLVLGFGIQRALPCPLSCAIRFSDSATSAPAA